MWTVVITPTCCTAGPQIHKYLKVLWGWSSYCCGAAHPAQQIRNRGEIRGWGKKQTSKKKTAATHQNWTFGARDWLIFSTNQLKVRLYTVLAKASRADSACSKLSGLITCETNISILTPNEIKKTQNKQTYLSFYLYMTSSPLALSFLCVSASSRAEPSTASSWKTTTHLFLAASPRRILCIFEHPVTQEGLFSPSQECWSEARWWYKFLPPPLLQTERFQGGGCCQRFSAGSGAKSKCLNPRKGVTHWHTPKA